MTKNLVNYECGCYHYQMVFCGFSYPKTNDLINGCDTVMNSGRISFPVVTCKSPIGLFDSGVGGLSIFLHLKQHLPNEHYLYFADTLHVPYGSRSSEDILSLTMQAVEWLCRRGCKLIVLACNSASAHALQQVRLAYPNIPIVGLVPALKPAVLSSQTRHVAVLATQATLDGRLLNDVIKQSANPLGVKVTKWFEPKLVPWVESGMSLSAPTAELLQQQLTIFHQDNIDALVLGCTHYPFFRDFLLQEIKKQQWQIQVMDSGKAIAMRVQSLLIQENMLNPDNDDSSLNFFATKLNDQLLMVVERLLKQKVNVIK